MNYIWQNKTVLAGEVSNMFCSCCLDELRVNIHGESNINVTLQESDHTGIWTDVTSVPIREQETMDYMILDGLKYRTARQEALYMPKGLYRLRCNKECVMSANYVFTTINA